MLNQTIVKISIIFVSLICQAGSASVADRMFSEKMDESHEFLLDKDFVSAHGSLDYLLRYRDKLDQSQIINVLYRLTELSYMLRSESLAKKYGDELYILLKKDPDYEKVFLRFRYRVCVSEDWKMFRHKFKDKCED